MIVLIRYGVLRLDNEALNDRFQKFYHHDIGPFWPLERRLVDSGYADIRFPLDASAAPDLAQFLGYVATWSATSRARGCRTATRPDRLRR